MRQVTALRSDLGLAHFPGDDPGGLDEAWDIVALIDAVPRARDPRQLLRTCARLARSRVIIKDRLRVGLAARWTLALMDRVENGGTGRRYLSPREWNEAFLDARLVAISWRDDLHLYAWPLRPIFERHLHFMAEFLPRATQGLSHPSPF